MKIYRNAINFFMLSLPFFPEVARGLAILKHLNSVSGIKVVVGWFTAGSSLIPRM